MCRVMSGFACRKRYGLVGIACGGRRRVTQQFGVLRSILQQQPEMANLHRPWLYPTGEFVYGSTRFRWEFECVGRASCLVHGLGIDAPHMSQQKETASRSVQLLDCSSQSLRKLASCLPGRDPSLNFKPIPADRKQIRCEPCRAELKFQLVVEKTEILLKGAESYESSLVYKWQRRQTHFATYSILQVLFNLGRVWVFSSRNREESHGLV